MDKIYSAAEEILMWLGQDPHNGLAFQTIQEKDWKSENFYELALSREQVEALRHLNNLPYWTRHWIAQEIVLADQRSLIYGKRTLPWDASTQYLDQIWYESSGYLGSESLHCIRQLIVHLHSSGAIFDFANLARNSLCADPRDKVYGSQNLLSPDFQIDVDYTKSVRDVYLEAAVIYDRYLVHTIEYLPSMLSLAMGMKLVKLPYLPDWWEEWIDRDKFDELRYSANQYSLEEYREKLVQYLEEEILSNQFTWMAKRFKTHMKWWWSQRPQ
jgi:hypothetical protein